MYVPRTPLFSEFSYGFAVTRELIAAEGETVQVAPVFPSLIAEAELGWDVFINRPGMPIFLQFKLSDFMKGKNAKEVKDGTFDPPFYRFHLRCAKDMNQHSLLVDLNNRGEDVRYIAPAFYLSDELNDAFNDKEVIDRSIQIKPSEIGDLAVGRHHIAFKAANGPWKPYSDGEGESRNAKSAREMLAETEIQFRRKHRAPIRQELERVDAELLEVFEARREERADFRRIQIGDVRERMRPIERIEFIARYFFDCQLFFVVEK